MILVKAFLAYYCEIALLLSTIHQSAILLSTFASPPSFTVLILARTIFLRRGDIYLPTFANFEELAFINQ